MESLRDKRGVAQPIVLGVALIILIALWLAAFHQLAQDKAAVLAAAERDAANLARAFEEHVVSTVRAIDQAMLHLRDEIQIDGESIEKEAGRIRAQLNADFVVQVGMIDDKGMLAYSDQGRPAKPLDLSDREHFTFHRGREDDVLFISKPVFGRVSQKWSIQFARPIRRADRSLAGVMVISIDPGYFTSFYKSIDVGPQGAITLVGADRVVRARASKLGSPSEPVGMTLPDRPFFNMDQPHAGTYAVVSAVDNIKRLGAYRRLSQYPLNVVVSLGDDDVFAAYTARRTAVVQVAFALTLLMAGAAAVIITQLSSRQRAEETLARQARELAQSNAELEAFAYAASHDLREPLRMVNSFLALLERRAAAKLNDEEREFIGFARDGAQRMDRLILDLLEYSRVGRLSQPFERVPLDQPLAGAQRTLGQALAETGATLQIPDGLPEVVGDPSELERLFQNLIGNALKYRHPERQPVIAITAERKAAEHLLHVADNGIGIAPEYFETIFALFQRLHGRGEYEGTGVGLALCRKIMHNHGGRIWVTATPDQGATFHLAFPTAATPQAATPS